MPITVNTYHSIEQLKSPWQQLDRVAAERIGSGSLSYMDYTFYQTFTWNCFLARSYRYSLRRMEFVTATEGTELLVILPLIIDPVSRSVKVMSGKIAGILNAVCPYRDERARKAMRAVIGYTEATYTGRWHRQFSDMPLHSLFIEDFMERGIACTQRESYHVPLDAFPTYDDYIASLGKNIYKNIRKAYNHLTTDGRQITLTVYDHDHQPSWRMLVKIWTLYYRRKLAWRNRQPSAWRNMVARLRARWQSWAGLHTKSMKQLHESRLYVLTIDGAVAAFMHVYLHEGHALMPKLAIDIGYSRYSPGILLVIETIRLLSAQGAVDFDMCRGDERYKKEVGGIVEMLARV